MLELRPVCENCGKLLAADSVEAMICTFECTFCLDCVQNKLFNVCPNCGGGFEKRPVRPKAELDKHPAIGMGVLKPVDRVKFQSMLDRYSAVDPELR